VKKYWQERESSYIDVVAFPNYLILTMAVQTISLELDLKNFIKRIKNLWPDPRNRRATLREIRDAWDIILRSNFQYIPPAVIRGLVGKDHQFQTIQEFWWAMKKDLFRVAATDRVFIKQKNNTIEWRHWLLTVNEHEQRLGEMITLVQLFVDMTLEGIEDKKG
jgi:hypothetical protein